MTRQIDRIPLDWDLFVDRYWDRAPVLITPGAQTPFHEQEVFDALVAAVQPPAHTPATQPLNTQLTLDRVVLEQPGELLPQPADGSLAGYDARLTRQLDGQSHALTVSTFHLFHHPQWARQRAFYTGLWERVGLPLNSAITTLFHGTYEHSPVGVHRDRFATFMFALRGHKRMRFWDRCPWEGSTSTMVDYAPYLPDSFSVDIAPGELLYWPSSYFHVGESDIDAQEHAAPRAATSVNIGVPRDFSRADFEPAEFLQDPSRETLLSGTPDLHRLPALASPVLTGPAPAGDDGQLPDDVPPVLAEAVEVLRRATASPRLTERTAALSLRRLTAGGFHPVPPPARKYAPFRHGAQLALTEPVLWTDTGHQRVCGAAGHTLVTSLTPEVLGRLLQLLDTGPVDVVALLDTVPPAQRGDVHDLLGALDTFRVLARS